MDYSEMTLKEIEEFDVGREAQLRGHGIYHGLIRELIFRLKQQPLFLCDSQRKKDLEYND